MQDLFVEFVPTLILLDSVFVSFLKVLGQHSVPVLPDGVHARLLTDGVNVGSGDPIRSRHIVLQVHFVTQVHLASDGRENETLLTPGTLNNEKIREIVS